MLKDVAIPADRLSRKWKHKMKYHNVFCIEIKQVCSKKMYDYTGNSWSHWKVTLGLKINLKTITGKH
jgi:hypothetical protein